MNDNNEQLHDEEMTPDTVAKVGPSQASDAIAENFSYTPQAIPHNYSVLRRGEVMFIQYPGQELILQPFAPWCNDLKSVEFVKEYFRYVGDPVNNSYSNVKERDDIVEWEELTPEAITDISTRLNVTFEDLPVYKFFQKLPDGSYRATHDLICQMLAVSPNANFPIYLARGHLGNADRHTNQFNYYTKFLMKGLEGENIIPNRPTLVRILQELVKRIKAGNFSRLEELEIPVKAVAQIFKAANAQPFEIYETLLRDQLRFVDNITEGDTIGFKLNENFIKMLFMCCPNEDYLD